MLKVIGLFRELQPEARADLPSIQESRDHLDPEVADSIASYLKTGTIVCDSMEIAKDPFDSAISIPGGSGLQSDGVWVWRQDLFHYVSRYRVKLDSDFVAHAMAKPEVDFDLDRCMEAMRTFAQALQPTAES